MCLRHGRFVTICLVYVLSGTLLYGQEQGLTGTQLTQTESRPVVPGAGSSHSTEQTPKVEAAGDAPPVGSSAAITVEPDYFTGALVGSYPVSLPAGRGGMIPPVSLDYRSAGGNSWLGPGWDLQMGSIERQTKSGVHYLADEYVYRTGHGAQTLVATGTNLFGTEIASGFEKFEKLVASDGRPYWRVTNSRGATREYGATATSRLANPAALNQIFAWHLNRVTDTLGNSMVLDYTLDGGNVYLHTIRYTEFQGLPAPNVVTFETESRNDIEVSYELGFAVTTAKRLKRILVDASGHRMPSLEFGYGTESEATDRSLLRSIAILSADGKQQLPATQYRYQGGPLTTSSLTRPGGPIPIDTMDRQCVTGDFNGDSLTDIACYSGAGGLWSLTLSSLTGWTTSSIAGPAPGSVGQQCLVADLNADGRSDLLCYTTVGGQWHRMLGNSTGWGDSVFLQASSPALPVSAQCVIGDMNGDGRADLACSKGGNNWEWTLSHGDAWGSTITVTGPDPGNSGRNVGAQCIASDFNADGRTDIACYPGRGDKWSLGLSTGSGWPLLDPPPSGPVPGNPIGLRCLFADFNGDRRTDMLCYAGSSNVGNQWYLALATATGFDAASSFLGPVTNSVASSDCVPIDMNGDGKADLTCQSSPGKWRTFLSTGTSFRDAGTSAGPVIPSGYGVYQACAVGDFNGDAKGDIACRFANTWQLLLSDGTTPDLLSGSTNVFGGTTSVQYTRAASLPDSRVPIPLDIVSGLTSDDGTGRPAVTTIGYTGGYFDVAHRDFRGFRTARVTGPQVGGVGATTVLRYHQGSSVEAGANDPEADGGYMRGRLDRIRILNQAAELLRQTSFLYGAAAGLPRFNPLQEISTQACENNQCDQETRVINFYDRFGNVVRTEDYGDTTTPDDDFTKIITYNYNEAKYLVSLPATEEILAGISGVTRRLAYTQYFYDSTDTCDKPSNVSVPTQGQLTRVARWVGGGLPDVEERTAFDEAGNVVCKADALGNRTAFVYDADKQFLLSSTNALGRQTQLSYYGVAGSPLDHGLFGLTRSVTDANHAVSSTEWDLLGRQVKTTSPLGNIATWTYTNLGTPLSQNVQMASGGLSTTSYLDGLGRTVITRRSGPQQKVVVRTTRFNTRGLAEAASLPYFDGNPPIGEISTVYDALQRPVDERDAAGNRSTTCYASGATDLIDANGHRTRRVMTATGRLLRVERYRGVFSHDCAALRTADAVSIQPYSVTQYLQDQLGRLTRITDAKGVATSLAYDGLGRRTFLMDPAVGQRQFTFDAAGNEIAWQSASGSKVFVQYDALHRPVQKDYGTPKPLGAGDVMSIYDDPTRNGIGRLTGTRNANVVRSISYDLEGRPVSIDRIVHGTAYHEGRTYDKLGRVIELLYPDGKRVTQSYDGPALASVRRGTTTYAAFSAYNAAGLPEQLRLGDGTLTTFSYEAPSNPDCPRATYRLCASRLLGRDGSETSEIAYGYDAKGNVVTTRESGLARSFINDELDRLRGVASSKTGVFASQGYRKAVLDANFPADWPAMSGSSSLIQLDEAFSYDSSDDLTWKSDVGTYSYPEPTAVTINPHAPRQVGNYVLTWDGDGNMLSGFGRTSAYDMEGRLIAVDLPRGRQRAVGHPAGATVQSFQYEYDSDGSRVRESGPAGISISIGGLAECKIGGACVDHIFAGSERVASEAADGGIAYYHRDNQSSPRLITNLSGKVTASYSYSAYGVPRVSGSVPPFLPTSFFFGDQPYATEAGIYLFGGRAYDPRMGRFLSPDEINPAPGSPQFLNRYSYAQDNPMSMVDPDGHFPWFVVGILLGALLGGVEAHFQHADVARGALMGAITAGFLEIPDAFELEGLAHAAVSIASGAASGGVTAAVGGGNVGRGILAGGILGGLDEAVYGESACGQYEASYWGSPASTPLGSVTQQLAKASIQGAAFGGMYAASTGSSIRSGVIRGARGGLLGEIGNMSFAHAAGFIGSGLSSSSPFPVFDNGQFVYKTPIYGELVSSGAITFSNVTFNSNRVFDPVGRDISGQYWLSVKPHEMSHTAWQTTVFGGAYVPAHALSMGFGWAWAAATSQQIKGAEHQFGFLENYAIGVKWFDVP
jgi:RHS repeat-associated protein